MALLHIPSTTRREDLAHGTWIWIHHIPSSVLSYKIAIFFSRSKIRLGGICCFLLQEQDKALRDLSDSEVLQFPLFLWTKSMKFLETGTALKALMQTSTKAPFSVIARDKVDMQESLGVSAVLNSEL